MAATTATLQLGWLASQLPPWRRFLRAARDPQQATLARFDELRAVLGPAAYGRHVGLDRCADLAAFQDRVPIVGYEELRPWIQRICQGEAGVLSTEPVELLERTGGSSGKDKLIPYTARLRREFAEAVGAWMVDLHRALPGLLGTRGYWSISRAVRRAERTTGGLRVGLDDDAEYFGPLARWVVGRTMAVPGHVARSADMEAWRAETCRYLLEAEDLGLISVWSPTFLGRLLDWLAEHRDGLRDQLSAPARRRLDAAGAELHVPTLWPRLALLSAWGDGFAAEQLEGLRSRLPGVAVQPKGVLATEGVVSFPLWGQEGGVLAASSHLIELREVDSGRCLWPHQARVGGTYQAVLTTGGGLVRYAMPDALEVLGHSGGLPRVRLLGRLDRGSDLVGEKLTQPFVQQALAPLVTRCRFAMLLPQAEPAGYVLVVDRDPPGPARVDSALSQAYHYRYARELAQLQPARVRLRADAWHRWERALEHQGLALGDQKPAMLETRPALAAALLED